MPQQWGGVIFQITKRVNSDGSDGFKYFWYDPRKEKRLLSRRQNVGGKVMIWGAFCEKRASG